MAVRHGTRTAYADGCRCDPCSTVQSRYMAERNRAKREKRVIAALPAVEDTSAPGEVESAVLAELDGLSTASSRPGLVAVAVSLARVLDTQSAVAQHPSAAHRLSEALDKLRRGADAKQSKLAAVRSLAKPARAAV